MPAMSAELKALRARHRKEDADEFNATLDTMIKHTKHCQKNANSADRKAVIACLICCSVGGKPFGYVIAFSRRLCSVQCRCMHVRLRRNACMQYCKFMMSARLCHVLSVRLCSHFITLWSYIATAYRRHI